MSPIMVDTATQSVEENWLIQRQIPDITTPSQGNLDMQQELDGFQSLRKEVRGYKEEDIGYRDEEIGYKDKKRKENQHSQENPRTPPKHMNQGRRVFRQDNYLNIISTMSPPTADVATQRDENGLVQRPSAAVVPALPAD
ncbi:hypothetical protein VE02_06680 [Pseudogymnoascus sp. 03VT05]|nr:hypothetical protein VE02_06680 [Pseudogymnoascus sp. 03VT05]